MPLSLSAVAIQEKNKLTSSTTWLIMLEITIPGVGTPVRVVKNNENISWAGSTWYAYPFELDEIVEESKGEVPQITIRVGNVDRVMDGYMQDYDSYCKTNGFSPITCNLYVVNSSNTGSSTPEVTHTFDLKQVKSDPFWCHFILGSGNLWNRRAPLNRIWKNQCRWVFKSTECGYAGATTTCDKTLYACRNMGGGSNSIRFGGFPGVGSRGVKVIGA